MKSIILCVRKMSHICTYSVRFDLDISEINLNRRFVMEFAYRDQIPYYIFELIQTTKTYTTDFK